MAKHSTAGTKWHYRFIHNNLTGTSVYFRVKTEGYKNA